MFKTAATGSVGGAYVNQNLPGTPGTVLDADDRNIVQDEMVNAVEATAQTLDPTGADRSQFARGQSILGGSASSSIDTGGADAYVLNPALAGMIPPSTYAMMNAFIAVFKVNVTSTGASTLNYNSLGVRSLVNRDGSAIGAGQLVAGDTVWVVWVNSSNRWEFLNSNALSSSVLTGLTGEPGVVLIAGSAQVPDVSIVAKGIGEPKIDDEAVFLRCLSDSSTESENVRDRVCQGFAFWETFVGVIVLGASFNLISLLKGATPGVYHYTFRTAMPNNKYCIVFGAQQDSALSPPVSTNLGVYNKLTTGFDIICYLVDGVTPVDFEIMSLAVFARV